MTTTQGTMPVEVPVGVSGAAGNPEWGSDVVMDVLRLLGVEYAAILPGATYRGIHDSAVNYTGNTRPELITCNHEMIAVAVASGYARATGKPGVAMLHNVVGLLNGSMMIYDAWCDREPLIVIGGTGPMDATHRRPWIDWVHTALVQGNLVRDFTKWDDQPSSVAAIPESLMRAYRIAATPPTGPVYVCFDSTHQEEKLTEPFQLPDVSRYKPAAPPAPDSGALSEAARRLVQADLPLIFADRVGRNPYAVPALVELVELLAAPVADLGARANFPSHHVLNFSTAAKSLLREADVVLGLDVVDLDGAMRLPVNYATRVAEKVEVPNRFVISISLDELMARGLTSDFQALPTVDLPMLGDTGQGIPMLVEECRKAIDGAARARIDARRYQLEARQTELRERQRQKVMESWDRPTINEVRLIGELWEAVKDQPFVLTRGRTNRAAPGVFQISGPEQYLGSGLGGAVGSGPGVALGAALALKNTGKLPIAMLGDGEFLMSVQALWTAAHYNIPSLWVINNNRSYYNDEAHQILVSKMRGRPVENAWIGQRIQDPDLDYAAMARTYSVEGIGPIEQPSDLGPALRRGVELASQGRMVVVDVRTDRRDTE